jgi:hypothetical protein
MQETSFPDCAGSLMSDHAPPTYKSAPQKCPSQKARPSKQAHPQCDVGGKL